jgi:hypothetical protein
MADEPKKPAKKRVRNRAHELARNKVLRERKESPPEEGETEEQKKERERQELLAAELLLLEKRTRDDPTDADRDVNFAYRNMGVPTITPLMAPSVAAWQWYLYARRDPQKFLETVVKREDAKTKQAGSITAQKIEDDKRHQFRLVENLLKQVSIDVETIIDDLMAKYPRDVLRRVKRFKEEWDSFIKEECQ